MFDSGSSKDVPSLLSYEQEEFNNTLFGATTPATLAPEQWPNTKDEPEQWLRKIDVITAPEQLSRTMGEQKEEEEENDVEMADEENHSGELGLCIKISLFLSCNKDPDKFLLKKSLLAPFNSQSI